jgi:hypothetical protein
MPAFSLAYTRLLTRDIGTNCSIPIAVTNASYANARQVARLHLHVISKVYRDVPLRHDLSVISREPPMSVSQSTYTGDWQIWTER